MLFGYNGLEGLVEPFTKWMDNAITVGSDRLGADGSLVDFNQQIEVSKQSNSSECGTKCSLLQIMQRRTLCHDHVSI